MVIMMCSCDSMNFNIFVLKIYVRVIVIKDYKDLLTTTIMYTLCTKCTQYLQDMQDVLHPSSAHNLKIRDKLRRILGS